MKYVDRISELEAALRRSELLVEQLQAQLNLRRRKQPASAGSAVEEVEVVAYRYRCTDVDGNPIPTWYYSDDAGSLGLREPLMTVAQHERIVAALSAQQSAQPEFCCKHSYKVAKQAAWDARDLTHCKCDHNEYCEHCWPDDFREGGKWHGGFETKQSVRASVPRELLDAVKELFDAKQAKEDFERENPGNSTKRWDACLYRIEAAEDALRALLNGGEA